MKDYIIDPRNKEEKGDYISKVLRMKDGTLTIIFADGRRFSGLIANRENMNKIIAIQEEQATRGVENSQIFVSRAKKSGIMTGVAAAVTCAAGTALSLCAGNLVTEDPLVLATGVGVITVLGTIPALIKFRKNKAIVEEIDKVAYRNEHIDELNNLFMYCNSLEGLDRTTKRKIRKRRDNAFSIRYVDDYTIEDLEKIVENIDREKYFGFQYTNQYKKTS